MKSVSKLLRSKPRPCFVPRSRVENKKNLEEGKEENGTSACDVEAPESRPAPVDFEEEPSAKVPRIEEVVELDKPTDPEFPSQEKPKPLVLPSKRFKFKPKLQPPSKLKDPPLAAIQEPPTQEPSTVDKVDDGNQPEPAAAFEVYKENDQLFLISKIGVSEDISIIEVNQENNSTVLEVTLPPSPMKILKPVPKLPNLARNKAQPVAPETVKTIIHERSKAPSLTYGRFHKEIQERFVKTFGNGPVDRAKLKMVDLIYYNPTSNPMNRHEEEVVMPVRESLNNTVESEGSSEGDCENVTVLTLDPEGNIIISDDNSNKVTEKENPAVKSRHSWSKADTIKFYKALHRIGADFSVMTKVFPDRDRKNLKSKFKREERVNPTLIDKVLSNPAQFNFEALQQELDDFSEIYSKKPPKKISSPRIAPHEDYSGLAPKKHAQTNPERNFTGLTVNSWETTEDLLNIQLPVAIKKFQAPQKLPAKQTKKFNQKKSPPKSLVRSLQAIIAEQEMEKNELSTDPSITYKNRMLNLTKAFTVSSESLNPPTDINITIEHEPESIDGTESSILCIE